MWGGEGDKAHGFMSLPNDMTIWTEADVEHTANMTLPVVLRPWFVV